MAEEYDAESPSHVISTMVMLLPYVRAERVTLLPVPLPFKEEIVPSEKLSTTATWSAQNLSALRFTSVSVARFVKRSHLCKAAGGGSTLAAVAYGF